MSTGDGGMTITNREDYWERIRLFVDKGYVRTGWGPRCYRFLAPNYRMSELTAAVGLSQLGKVDRVVQRRRELGELLGSLIDPIEGVERAASTPGSEHSYWMYPFRVRRWPAHLFGEALQAEGISNLPGYTGVPMYLCSEALTEARTYGTSRFPLEGRSYVKGLCPVAEQALNQIIAVGFHEGYSEGDIRDIAGAIEKVATHL